MGRRIVKSSSVMEAKRAVKADVAPAKPLGQYWDRLKNLIPSEVSAIYVAGLGVIPKEQSLGIVMWAYGSGNPAWLANRVYALPNAQVIFESQDAA